VLHLNDILFCNLICVLLEINFLSCFDLDLNFGSTCYIEIGLELELKWNLDFNFWKWNSL